MKNVKVDEKGDFIFSFSIPKRSDKERLELEDYYRQRLLQLVHLMKFRFNGDLVNVDSFSFKNEPDKTISLYKHNVNELYNENKQATQSKQSGTSEFVLEKIDIG